MIVAVLVFISVVVTLLFNKFGWAYDRGTIGFIVLHTLYFITIICSVYYFLSLRKRQKKGNKKTTKKLKEESKPDAENPVRANTLKNNEQPKFIDVKGKEGYCFAEYPDRYELYQKTDRGLIRVRTDYKNKENL